MAYATVDDFKAYGLPAEMLASFYDPSAVPPIDDLTPKLEAASGIADGFLRTHYTLPIQAPYPADLVDAVCRIAAYNLLSWRGFNPQGDAQQIRDRYLDAMEWLKGVSKGHISPNINDATGKSDDGGPFVVAPRQGATSGFGTPRLRGW